MDHRHPQWLFGGPGSHLAVFIFARWPLSSSFPERRSRRKTTTLSLSCQRLVVSLVKMKRQKRHQKISDESSRIQNALLRACNAMPSYMWKPHVENLTDCLCTMSAVLSRVSWFATKIQFPDGWMVKFRGCSPEPLINSKGTFWHIWRIPGLRL
jgi:hypothetical protein